MDHLDLFVMRLDNVRTQLILCEFPESVSCSNFGNLCQTPPPRLGPTKSSPKMGFQTPRVHAKFLAAASRPPMIHMPLLPENWWKMGMGLLWIRMWFR